MPPPPPERQYNWVLSLDACPNACYGTSENEEFDSRTGRRNPRKKNEDRWFNGMRSNIHLCMVLDGHDGDRAAEFASVHLAGKLLGDDILHERDIPSLIRRAFRQTEIDFFKRLDDAIIRRMALIAEVRQRAKNDYEASRIFPEQVKEIERLSSQIKGGTTVVLSLIHNNNLYIANVGDSRALLCHNNAGYVQVNQLSDDHNVFNPGEQERLRRMGLNIDELKHFRRLGPFETTRSIGDYSIKGGYKDVDILQMAREEPGSCEPFINGPWNIHQLPRSAFIMLMSDGLYETYSECINSKDTKIVHEGLAKIVVEEMTLHRRLDRVAMMTINRVKEQYRQQFVEGIHVMDDITLVIYNLSYPIMDKPKSGPINQGGFFVPTAEPSVVDEPDRPGNWNPRSGEITLSRNKPSRESFEDRFQNLSIKKSPDKMPPPPKPEPMIPTKPQLTKEQEASGKFIAPYVTFPVDFPHDLDLQSL